MHGRVGRLGLWIQDELGPRTITACSSPPVTPIQPPGQVCRIVDEHERPIGVELVGGFDGRCDGVQFMILSLSCGLVGALL